MFKLHTLQSFDPKKHFQSQNCVCFFALKKMKKNLKTLLEFEKISVLPETARSAQTVVNTNSFFNVSYTWYKSLGATRLNMASMTLNNDALAEMIIIITLCNITYL